MRMVHNSYYQYPDGVAVQGAWSVLAVPMVRPTSLKLTPYAINTTREWLNDSVDNYLNSMVYKGPCPIREVVNGGKRHLRTLGSGVVTETKASQYIASPKVHTDVEIPDVSLSRLHGGMTKTGDDTETIGFPSIGFNRELLSQGSDLH